MKRNKRDITLNELAVMVKRGFDGVDMQFNETAKKKDMDQRFDKIEREIAALKAEVSLIRSELEDIKLRMTEMAFRFEVKDVEKRLRKVEMKLKMKQA